MSKTIDSLYPQGSVNAKRIDTDTLFSDGDVVCKYEGMLDKAINYIAEFQLMDPVHWARFVDQFKIHSDSNGGWRGEYWGKMMRGACFVYGCTRDEKLYEVLHETVADMLTAEDELGRISARSVETEFTNWDIWCRKYVLLGMQYFLEINRDKELEAKVIESMKHQVDYMIAKLGNEPGKIRITTATNNWRGLNSSSVLEPVVRLYDLTGEQKYLDFAAYIVGEGGTSICNVFELAFEDLTDPYQYPVVKAYELTSCFEGLLEYYRATGIEKWRDAVIKYAYRLMNTDITIIGSAGCTHELLDHSAARQTDPTYKGIMQETCVTVTWMKFCWQLLSLTGDPKFADSFEQALYNAYLGAVNTEKILDDTIILGKNPDAILEPLPFDSYSALLPGTRGRGIGGLCFMPDNHYYGCCACIGAAGIGLLSKVGTMVSKDGLTVNLYIPGTVTTRTPAGQSLTLRTVTDYPAGGEAAMTVEVENAEEFTLNVRIPAWSRRTAITVNGEAIDVTAGYTSIRRIWKKGDKVELSLDMRTFVIKPIPNPRDILMTKTAWGTDYHVPHVVVESPYAKYHIAMQRGPLVLARDARLGDGDVCDPVNIKYDADGVVEVTPSATAGFDTVVEFDVPLVHGGSFKAIDYSSAGKTWREDSKYGCWLPTRKYTR
ncbi:MAG: glycoside hydrolase family 127 protein [Clostridia bacterium]|nr:glycoside hydrolase family 127 protein [Clostridia bacterium]